ncbi:amidohydrolase family protein [Escherichia coli]|nr:amidohydrolase family protein [Escherichia coli]EJV2646727.1 amidohydrolase family protein [Escherichia coli]EJV9167068.1 amidohydrolase family protein [Escherichia coli]EKE7376560.1 amidohydrolase family protein [Escherichia coli]
MIINNVKLVLENEVVHGSLEVQDGEIRAFAESQSRLPEAMDGEGGWLLPGLIELHTDNLDKFFTPRPKVDWPAHSAMSSLDALMVASGITTVLDAVAIGDVRDGGDRLENLEKMINAIEETQKRGVNRAEHRLHLRCELPHHTTLPLFEKLAQLGLLDILSSDYYPASLLDAAFRVADDQSNRFTLPQAVRLVTKNPAQALNLQDRGVIGEGNRADLVLAHRKGNHIHIDHVWRQGKRVF